MCIGACPHAALELQETRGVKKPPRNALAYLCRILPNIVKNTLNALKIHKVRRCGGGEVEVKVVVIGAGAAGMAATYALRKAGTDVTTFDARSEAGGRARCYQKEGFTFDTGAQFMAKVCSTQIRLC